MMRSTPMAALVLLALTAGLQGCASQRSEAALDEASATFQKVKDDSDVLRSASDAVAYPLTRWPAAWRALA